MNSGKANNTNSFFSKVYKTVCKIPLGKVTTYGAIANYLGTKRSSRMVGWAMNKSHGQYPTVPAHRVVNRNGYLTGKQHFMNPAMMQELLENEGVTVINDKVQNFNKVFWDPGKELNSNFQLKNKYSMNN